MIYIQRLAWASLRDFHEPLLNELHRSRHGIGVDLDPGKQVCVSPVMYFCGRAAKLNLDAVCHDVS